MDCNKDEALKAKQIAERILETDIMRAKKFALKAQNLFPNLEGLSQFLEIIEVYVAYDKKINGEIDYYGIFGVDPFVDEEVLKKRYKRMALSLHPDKNKSVGADGAFQILSEAWSVLSDKDKRSAYNLKLNISASNQASNFSWSSAPLTTTATNSQDVPARSHTPPMATSQRYTTTSTSGQQASRLEMFWTSCNRCTTQFQYKKIFLNQIILCDLCKQPFFAIEVPAPTVNDHGSRSWPFPCQQQDMPTANNSQNVPTQPWTSSTTFNQWYTATDTTNQQTPGPPLHQHYTATRNQQTWSPHALRFDTFWTSCNKCGVQFEYEKIYLNQNLLCKNCKKPFLAIDLSFNLQS